MLSHPISRRPARRFTWIAAFWMIFLGMSTGSGAYGTGRAEGPFLAGDKILLENISGIVVIPVRDCMTLSNCEVSVSAEDNPAIEYYRGYLLHSEDLDKSHVTLPPVDDDALADFCSNRLLKTRVEYRLHFRGMDGTTDRLVVFSDKTIPKAPHCAASQGSLGNGEVSIFEFYSETNGLMIEDTNTDASQ